MLSNDVILLIATYFPERQDFDNFMAAMAPWAHGQRSVLLAKALVRYSGSVRLFQHRVFQEPCDDALVAHVVRLGGFDLDAQVTQTLQADKVDDVALPLRHNLPGFVSRLLAETILVPHLLANPTHALTLLKEASHYGHAQTLSLLWQAGVRCQPDPDWKDIHTLFCFTAARGSSDTLRFWFDEIDQGVLAPHLSCALELAAVNGQLENCIELVGHGASVLPHAIVGSAKNGHLGVLQFFVESCGMDHRVEEEAAFVDAVENNCEQIVEFLLQQGISHRSITEALITCAENDFHTLIPHLFVHDSALSFSHHAKKALVTACSKGYTKVVELLIQFKVPVGLCTFGGAAIYEAVKFGSQEIVEMLLKNGGIRHRKACFRSAKYACLNGNYDMFETFLQYKCIDLATNSHELLFQAIEMKEYPVVTLLLKYGDDIQARNNLPLLMAAKTGDLALFRILLKFDPFGLYLGKSGKEAFMYSLFNRSWEFMTALLTSGLVKVGDTIVTVDMIKDLIAKENSHSSRQQVIRYFDQLHKQAIIVSTPVGGG